VTNEEIDIAVHTDVMGYTYRPDDENGDFRWHDRDGNPCPLYAEEPKYSTDWAAMGEVLERFSVGMVEIHNGWGEEHGDRVGGWACRICCPGEAGEARAHTLPLAVALAALKAVGQEVKHERA
jgi:hypothetical protein